jgi:RNA polymerase sigma-70 factor (ECF subfamily)
VTSGEGRSAPEDAGPDDRDLLAAHIAGDSAAFGTLFARHRDRLWAVALRTTGDPEEAADALQDALVAAFRRAESYRGDAAVTTWLHRIVVNAALDRLRRRRTRRTSSLPEDDTERQDLVLRDSSEGGDPADSAIRSDRRREVHAALATLSPEQRAALVLVDMEGRSVEEAAGILGVPAGTVKSRCSRGRARLLPLLAPRPDDPRGDERHEGNHGSGTDVPSAGDPGRRGGGQR